jgi:hypothetical protein
LGLYSHRPNTKLSEARPPQTLEKFPHSYSSLEWILLVPFYIVQHCEIDARKDRHRTTWVLVLFAQRAFDFCIACGVLPLALLDAAWPSQKQPFRDIYSGLASHKPNLPRLHGPSITSCISVVSGNPSGNHQISHPNNLRVRRRRSAAARPPVLSCSSARRPTDMHNCGRLHLH